MSNWASCSMCWWRSWCWEFWFIAFVKASSPWMSAACGGSADDAGSSVGDSAGGVARRRAVLEAVNVAAFGLTFLLALAVASQVLRSGAISLFNGFLYADALSALVILLNASVALVCAVYAVGYLREDERTGALDGEEGSHGAAAKLRMYYSLTPLLVFSLLLVALANNLGVMWAAIELTTLAIEGARAFVFAEVADGINRAHQ